MTEAEWLGCSDPQKMLEFLQGTASERKLRLFGVAGCRQFWHSFSENRSRRAVEVAERYADRLATVEELRAARQEVLEWGDLIANQDFEGVALAGVAADVAKVPLGRLRLRTPALLRDIFGNPFRRGEIDPAFLTPLVVSLAEAAYDERSLPSGELDPHRLAVLADALEEAGAAEQIVGHLRDTGPHVRGCWVVDLCLGKQ